MNNDVKIWTASCITFAVCLGMIMLTNCGTAQRMCLSHVDQKLHDPAICLTLED